MTVRILTGDAATYAAFLATKGKRPEAAGIDSYTPNPMLYAFQADIVRWALRQGRAAIFADCGMGKTPMQLEWAANIPGPVLVVAPLAVSDQTCREAEKFGIDACYAPDMPAHPSAICVTNYERIERFDPDAFAGIVLDESSIIKNRDGKFRRYISQAFAGVPFRLSCTATPAPNDYMELGTQAAFLGVSTIEEMLATYFVHDGGDTSKWRLKGHAKGAFWEWLASWSVMMRSPVDLGYDAGGFDLPPLEYHSHVVRSQWSNGSLVPVAVSLQERQSARRESLAERVAHCADLVNGSHEPWIVWCNLNAESEALAKAIPDAVEVRGSDDADVKRDRLIGFSAGRHRVIVTKPTIAGHGMNWQHCANMAFVGLSDSWEQYYQAVRRCWRFMQTRTVNVHVITSDAEGEVVANIKRKEAAAAEMLGAMVASVSRLSERNIKGREVAMRADHVEDTERGDAWTMHMGDCVEVLSRMAPASVDYSVFSPPFASLYTYTDSARDMGNVHSDEEFHDHFRFAIRELTRVIKPGRLISFHCMQLPMSKVRDGVIGLRDFRGDLIRAFTAEGLIYHSEVCIWKDPVTSMQRTKALGLLHKQLKKDACMSRQGIADYVVTMRAPGENPAPVENTDSSFPVAVWQRYASPVWMDINPSDTLQYQSAREHEDERHICPLQLDVIRRCVRLWSNPGDLVLSPFAGIGSEGHVAVEMGRRFVGIELKASYYRQAVANLREVETMPADLFATA